MKLYKSEGINPASGCLPILVQIPIFFSLYKLLLLDISMRHAPFVWIWEDLSAKDPVTIFNLFGLLPYDVPSFLEIGLLPLVNGYHNVFTTTFKSISNDRPYTKKYLLFSFFYNYNISSICCWFNTLLDYDKYFNNHSAMDYS